MVNTSNSDRPTIGFWISAVAAIISAIAATPSVKLPSKVSRVDVLLVASAIQILGSTIIIESVEPWNIRTGRIVRIIGNGIGIRGLLETDQVTAIGYSTEANLFQTLAGTISFDYEGNLDNAYLYNVGVLMLIIGNAFQAIFTKVKLIDLEKGTELVSIAAWIKAVGAVIVALSFSI